MISGGLGNCQQGEENINRQLKRINRNPAQMNDFLARVLPQIMAMIGKNLCFYVFLYLDC
jgi:hypothetical protein